MAVEHQVGIASTTFHYFSLEECLRESSASGFRKVEILSVPGFCDHIDPPPEKFGKADAQRTLALCRNYGMTLSGIGGHLRLMRPGSVAAFKAVIDTTELLGSHLITTDTGQVRNGEEEKRFYREMEELAEYAESKSIVICLEPHGDWGGNGKSLSEIAKKTGRKNVRVNYDTGNVVYYTGTRPEEDLQYALPYLAFVHLKDTGGKKGEYNFPILGKGTVDFDIVLRLIENIDIPLSLELEFDGQKHPLEYVTAGTKACTEFLLSHGLTL